VFPILTTIVSSCYTVIVSRQDSIGHFGSIPYSQTYLLLCLVCSMCFWYIYWNDLYCYNI